MNIEAMTKWIEALEDPANEKRQIRGNFSNGEGGVCAEGLGYEVICDWERTEEDGFPPWDIDLATHGLGWTPGEPVPTMVKLEDGRTVSVHRLNDTGMSFWDIAQALRATHLKENT